MKKVVIFSISIIIVSLLTIYMTSCNKENECKSCQENLQTITKEIYLKISPIISNKIPNAILHNIKGKENMCLSHVIFDEENFKNLANLTQQDVNPEVMVLYLNSNLIENQEISINSIKAVSTFELSQTGKMYKHNFYTNNRTKFVNDPYLSLHTCLISLSAIDSLNYSIVKSQKNSLVFVSKSNSKWLKSNNKVDVLRTAAKHYTEIKNQIQTKTGSLKTESINHLEEIITLLISKYYSTEYLTEKCHVLYCNDGGAKGSCVVDQFNNYNCVAKNGGGGGGHCRVVEVSNFVDADKNSTYPLNTADAFNTTLQYNFRDSFLTQTNLGKKYNTLYYYFSEVYSGKISPSICLQTIKILIKVNERLEKLCNNNTDASTEIFVDTNLGSEIISLINEYRNIYTDEYNEILINDFINDFNEKIVGKSISDIKYLLRN